MEIRAPLRPPTKTKEKEMNKRKEDTTQSTTAHTRILVVYHTKKNIQKSSLLFNVRFNDEINHQKKILREEKKLTTFN